MFAWVLDRSWHPGARSVVVEGFLGFRRSETAREGGRTRLESGCRGGETTRTVLQLLDPSKRVLRCGILRTWHSRGKRLVKSHSEGSRA